MCGIVAALSFDGEPVNQIIKKQFKAQRQRGIEGFGLFDYEYKNLVRETMEHNILKWLDRYPSSNIMFHHRLPTSTINVKSAAHPFSTKDFFRTNYVLVHNGVIYNSEALKAEHEKLGIEYSSVQPDGSFNDSEALLWDVALLLEGKQEVLHATGGIAFVCIGLGKGNKHDRMYFGRNTYPLNFLNTEAGIVLSSEGVGESIEPHTLYEFDYVNHKLKTTPLDIDHYIPTRTSYTAYDYEPYQGRMTDDDWVEMYEDMGLISDVSQKLIRNYKISPVAIDAEVEVLYRRLMEDADGWYADAIDQAEAEYDCMTVYLEQLRRDGLNTDDAKYTLDLYERVVDMFEIESYSRLSNPLYQASIKEV